MKSTSYEIPVYSPVTSSPVDLNIPYKPKAKVSVFNLIKSYTMKAYGGVEV
jgi:hypothetical protein